MRCLIKRKQRYYLKDLKPINGKKVRFYYSGDEEFKKGFYKGIFQTLENNLGLVISLKTGFFRKVNKRFYTGKIRNLMYKED